MHVEPVPKCVHCGAPLGISHMMDSIVSTGGLPYPRFQLPTIGRNPKKNLEN